MWNKHKKTSIGLDIGASAIKVVEIERQGNDIHLVKYGVAPLDPETIVDGEIMDRQMVVEMIQNLFESCGIRRRRVIAGIHGRGVIVKKIVMERLPEEQAAEAIYWEAEQHIPYDINDVSIDFEILPAEIGPNQMQVLLVAAKRDLIINLADIIREAGLTPEAVDVNSFAVQNVVEMTHDLRPDEFAVLLDLGAEITNVNIIRDGVPLYTQDLSTGINTVVRAVQKRFQVSREEAVQALQSSTGKLDVQPMIESFCKDVAGSLEKAATYLKTSGEAEQLDKIFISGGGARIGGFIETLTAVQPLPVEIINPLKRLRVAPDVFQGSDPQDIAPQLTVGVGLALRKGA